MANVIQPFRLLVITLPGWLDRHQQAAIDYLIEENRVLKDQLKDSGFVLLMNSGIVNAR